MKLLFCPVCQDVIKLGKNERRNYICGESGGNYFEDRLNAVIYGKAIPIGFANSTFVMALENQPETGWGKKFEVFVIPKKCSTIKVEK